MPTTVVADLGDRDDSFYDWDEPSIVDAGSGNDTPITGAAGDDVLRGGIGSDVLEGYDGNDLLDGGPGDDYLEGIAYVEEGMTHGSDTYVGGGGSDSLTYEGRTEDLALSPDGVANDGAPGESDDIGTDVVAVTGGHGADVMTGNGRLNVFAGGEGDDVLTGAGGDDHLVGASGADRLSGDDGQDLLGGEDGDDLLVGGSGVDLFFGDSVSACIAYSCPSGRDDIRARDGEREQISCGPGTDTLEHDPVDVVVDRVTLADQCEGILGGGNARSGPGASPAFRIAAAKVDRQNRIRVRLTVPGPGKVQARATARRRGKAIRVAGATRKLTKADDVTLTLAPSRAAKRALRLQKRLKVSVKIAFKPRKGAGVRAVRRVTLVRSR